jgi:ubiquinone/menaquinone biosynthesis C-methylase UbiE
MAFEALKERQSAAWGSAPFTKIAQGISAMHDTLVASLAPREGERWLDAACGTGEVAFRAARAGADVVGSDLSPVLIETARRQAREQGLEIDFGVADCEQLPYPDGSFDVVASSVGVVFAPDHKRVACELARVCRSGGRIGVTAWRKASGVGQLFAAMAPFQPPPPEGAGSPFQWADEDYATQLLGDAFELSFSEHGAPEDSPSGEAMWQLYAEDYGPSHTLATSLPPDRRAELDDAMAAFFERSRDGDRIHWLRDYLLILGTRR